MKVGFGRVSRLRNSCQTKQTEYLSTLRETWGNSIRLTQMVWRDARSICFWLLALVIFGSVAAFLRTVAQALLLNELPVSGPTRAVSSRLIWAVAFVIIITLLPQLSAVVENYFRRRFGTYLEQKCTLLILQQKGQLNISLHEDPATNNLISLVSEQGAHHVQGFLDRLFLLIQGVVGVILSLSALTLTSWWVPAGLTVAVIPELVVGVQYGRRVWSIHRGRSELRRKCTELSSHFARVAGVAELKIFQNTSLFLQNIASIFGSFRDEQDENERRELKRVLGACLTAELATIGAFLWFVVSVVHGELQIGTFWFLVASVGSLRSALYFLSHNIAEQYQSNLFVTDFFRFLDLKPNLAVPHSPIHLATRDTPQIRFERVTFRYPGSAQPVLRDFSLTIYAGEKLGLVGVNGAGKSTFIKLLCRFYDPQKGRITIDGVDLRELDLDSWYGQLGVLFQDFSNYRAPVCQAIALGRSNEPFDEEKMLSAADLSHCDRFIHRWPGVFDQMLGNEFADGIEPSGGQWQKLALARALYRDPRVLILDEPTASVDAESEARILEQLTRGSDRTVILIAHRFSVLRNTDRICVLEAGSVKELGTHHELLDSSGTYAQLFTLQAAGYERTRRLPLGDTEPQPAFSQS